MASILFLVPAFNKPSTRLRIECMESSIKLAGHRAEFLEIPKNVIKRLHLLSYVSNFNLVILQKKLFKPVYLKILAKNCHKLIFDYDDAIMFHEVERGYPLSGKFFNHFVSTIRQCDGVIAGNNYLANFAKEAVTDKNKTSILVLPTSIDFNHHERLNVDDNSAITLGWIGTKGNLEHLYHIADSLAQAYQKNSNIRLKILCDDKPEIPGIKIDFIEWSKENENYHLNTFDIGLMPLKDTIWTQGKGGYKLLQYLAVGKASIASPIGINAEIISSGINGILARTTEQWAQAILDLAESKEKRNEMGDNAYHHAKSHFSLEKYQHNYLKFIEQIL